MFQGIDENRVIKRLEKALQTPHRTASERIPWSEVLTQVCPCMRARHSRAADWWCETATRAFHQGWEETQHDRDQLRQEVHELFEGEGRHAKRPDRAARQTLAAPDSPRLPKVGPGAEPVSPQSPRSPRSPTSPAASSVAGRESQWGSGLASPGPHTATQQGLKNYPTMCELVEKDKMYVEEAVDLTRSTGLPFTASVDLSVFASAREEALCIVDEKLEIKMGDVLKWFKVNEVRIASPLPAWQAAGFSHDDCRVVAPVVFSPELAVPHVPAPRKYRSFAQALPVPSPPMEFVFFQRFVPEEDSEDGNQSAGYAPSAAPSGASTVTTTRQDTTYSTPPVTQPPSVVKLPEKPKDAPTDSSLEVRVQKENAGGNTKKVGIFSGIVSPTRK